MPEPLHPADAGFGHASAPGPGIFMNISKYEQRVLHALAQGGHIAHLRDDTGHVAQIDCLTRDGWRLSDCTPSVFRRLKRRRLIASSGGQSYRITREGLAAVRGQLDNR